MSNHNYNRRDFLRSTGAAFLGFAAGRTLDDARTAVSRANRPNIIYIMLDELGYFELSCMGNDKLKTPNIDRIVSEGMRFTQCLAGGCVCAPTRSVLMTGKHAGHTTVRQNGGGLALRRVDTTIADILKRGGYATGGFGKWGLGDCGTTGVPESHGFDVFYGYYHQVHAHSYYPRYLLRNSVKEYLPGNTGDYYKGGTFAQYRIFDETMKFIRANKNKPFFCYCPWTPPHGLWGFPKDDPAWKLYKDKPWTAGQRKSTDSRVYAAMVNMIDRQVGQILAILEELDLDRITILFFCGANGGQPYFYRGEPGKPKSKEPPFPNGFFGPNLNPKTGERFRGGKGNLYEGGLRIPFIVRWPGHIEAGSTTDHLCCFTDIMPTLAELVDTKPAADTDGISMTPTLLGERKVGRKQKKHKYLYWEFGGQVAVRMDNYKAVKPGPNKPFELYDLSADIEEKVNIAGRHPQIVKQLAAFAQEAHTENIPGGYLPGGREKGFKGHQAD